MLVRHLLQLPLPQREAVDAWRDRVTAGSRRTLVAVHIRRGDYRILQLKGTPHFRIVPEDWYLDWLRNIWPTLHEPLLFVATDDPLVLRKFREFETAPAEFGVEMAKLPGHVRDFEILRRADYLAICNSSYSRMAAILASSKQKCFLPSFETQSFERYEPWEDRCFWARFANTWRETMRRPKALEAPLPAAGTSIGAAEAQPTILFDVSDLISYLLDHATVTGIQRVQCEILGNLVNVPEARPFRFVIYHRDGFKVIETSGLLVLIEDIRSKTAFKPEFKAAVRALRRSATPCQLRPRDVFLSLGAFWNVRGFGVLLQQLKNSGIIVGIFAHDILPITEPEYFEPRSKKVHVKALTDGMPFVDFILTTTEYNKTSIGRYLASRNLTPIPIEVVPLGHELALSAETESEISGEVAGFFGKQFVLCVGTLESRKNPLYLFNVWKMLVRSGRSNIPYLVFVGRKSSFVQDFMDHLSACDYLGGRIVVLHNVTDVELDMLYRTCMLTMFPSFVEGWGLPVGESLARGKICLASDSGGIPEAGGKFVDYIDPYNVNDGFQKLSQYLDDPERRQKREREIAENFEPRSWLTVAGQVMNATGELAQEVGPFEGVAAISLPSNRYLPISGAIEPNSADALPGMPSPELICVSGWHPAEQLGARPAAAEAMVRFRTDAVAGAKVNLALRLAAQGRDFRIRIRSRSGAETQASVRAGSENLAILTCEVEAGSLVTATLSSMESNVWESANVCFWTLAGVLYFDPKSIATNAFSTKDGVRGATRTSMKVAPPAAPTSAHPETTSRPNSIVLRSVEMDTSAGVRSVQQFAVKTDCYWPFEFHSHRGSPIFADPADKRAFQTGCGNHAHLPAVGRVSEYIKLTRRSEQFVSMSRFSEGSVFDRSGVMKAFGYLSGAPSKHTPWVSHEPEGLRVEEAALAAAPYYDHSVLVFYNGNLQNYYHWLVEGLLGLEVLHQALGPHSGRKIVLPKSREIAAVFDHRATVAATGFGEYEVLEAGENFIKVREAIWMESDHIHNIPAPYVKSFQQRVAGLYTSFRSVRKKRLLVARRGPARKIHNLEQIQALLSRYDFETVYLEGMSFRDQILLFLNAEFVISPHGAGLANLLFCEPGTKVIELMPSAELRPFFWLISEKLELVHGMQFCAPVGEGDFQAEMHVDIDKLEALVRMLDLHM